MERNELELGAMLASDGSGDPVSYEVPTDHLVTHGVILGMTIPTT